MGNACRQLSQRDHPVFLDHLLDIGFELFGLLVPPVRKFSGNIPPELDHQCDISGIIFDRIGGQVAVHRSTVRSRMVMDDMDILAGPQGFKHGALHLGKGARTGGVDSVGNFIAMGTDNFILSLFHRIKIGVIGIGNGEIRIDKDNGRRALPDQDQ